MHQLQTNPGFGWQENNTDDDALLLRMLHTDTPAITRRYKITKSQSIGQENYP
jgi:hypothetical protein